MEAETWNTHDVVNKVVNTEDGMVNSDRKGWMDRMGGQVLGTREIQPPAVDGRSVLDVVGYATNKLHNVHFGKKLGIAVGGHIVCMARMQVQVQGEDHSTGHKTEQVEVGDKGLDKGQQRKGDKLCMGPHKHRVVHMDLSDMTEVENR